MTSLIIRHDAIQNKKIAFVADSIDRGQMLAWAGKGQPEIVGVDMYHRTKAVPKKQAEEVAKQYARTFNETEVHIRERLPKDYMINGGVYKQTQKTKKSRAKKQTTSLDVQALATQIAKLLAASK